MKKEDLQEMGHHVVEISAVGDVQAVGRSPNGWVGASDSRSEGAAMAY